jgi:predicted enzyme related to lactoylglutathione lyase
MSTGVQTAVGRFVWHDHISADPETARRFYGVLLGWETEIWKAGELVYPMISVDGEAHGGFGRAPEGAPSYWLAHGLVRDVDEAVLRVEAVGGSVIEPAMDLPDVGRMAVVSDPQGAVFSVFAPVEDPPTAHGVFAGDELLTTDIDAAKTFYREVFGWEARDVDGLTGPYTLFRSGETDRAGGMQRRADMTEVPPHWLSYLATDDVGATLARAHSLGAHTAFGPADIAGEGRIAVAVDPTGAAFGLFRPLA